MKLETEISNYDAEKHVLSCILIENYLVNVCKLQPKHFHNPQLSKIYEAMKAIVDAWKPIENPILIQMVEWLTNDEIYDIYTTAILTTGFETNCDIVLENYNRREMKKTAQRVIAFCEDTTIWFDELLTEANKVTVTEQKEKTFDVQSWVIETYQNLFEKKQSLMIAETTGLVNIDTLIGGYRAGSLYIVWARPSVWKSTLAINLVLQLGKMWVPTALFSTEMPPQEIHIRMLACVTNTPWRTIEKWQEAVSEKVIEWVTTLTNYANCNIYNDFTSETLERLMVREVMNGARVIFIDYLQNIKIPRMKGTRNDEIGNITAMLKQVALKYGVAVVCLAQLNRQIQNDAEPELMHLRDSWNIEQDADIVMFLHRYDETNREIELYVKKNRHWQLWMVNVGYRKDTFTFYNMIR